MAKKTIQDDNCSELKKFIQETVEKAVQDIQKIVKEELKNKRKASVETKTKLDIFTSTGQSCYVCNKEIDKDVKCIRLTIQERIGMHVDDFETVEKKYVHMDCYELEKYKKRRGDKT